MKTSLPLISVILPVYNSDKYLKEAIDSLLGQSYSNFELIILDDGSTDMSVAVIEQFEDDRIKLVKQDSNKGLVSTLNRGLSLATGEYIARMDSDDIALPLRFQKQLDFLEENKEFIAIGTRIIRIGETKSSIDFRPIVPEICEALLLFGTPLVHPTVMFRRSQVAEYGLEYDPLFNCTEDYEFWTRLQSYGKIANLSEKLLKYRVREQGVTGTRLNEMRDQQNTIHSRLLDALSIKTEHQQLKFHQKVSEGRRLNTVIELEKAKSWLKFLMQQNSIRKKYDDKGLLEAVSYIWFRLIRNCTNLGIATIRAHFGFKEVSFKGYPLRLIALFFLSCIYHQIIHIRR